MIFTEFLENKKSFRWKTEKKKINNKNAGWNEENSKTKLQICC